MKPELFAVAIKENVEDETFNYLFQFVEKDKQARVNRLKFKKDKDLTVDGDILAKTAISKVFGIAAADMKFGVGEFGKPYLASHKDAHYNISHSGSIVVCAVYDKPIGIDIQKMNDMNFDSIAKRVFTKNEQEIYFSAPTEMQKEQFYRIWTAKESLIKFLGTGVRDLSKEIEPDCVIGSSCVFDDYILAVCCKP